MEFAYRLGEQTGYSDELGLIARTAPKSVRNAINTSHVARLTIEAFAFAV